MKTLVASIFAASFLALSASAQGTFQFRIDFPGSATPPAVSFPAGSAALTDGVLRLVIQMGGTLPTSGRIVDVPGNAETTSVFELSNLEVSSFPPSPGVPGSGGTFYSYAHNWTLTEFQTQRLFGGAWQVEVQSGASVWRGAFVPVPEPGAGSLAILGCGALAVVVGRERRPHPVDC